MNPSSGSRKPVDLNAIRARLQSAKGQEYWRSLEEVAGSEDFQAFLQHEFPNQLPGWLSAVDRRGFLRLLGASLALAGMSACTRQPTEKIVPYVIPPEEAVPGKPLFFATAMPVEGFATGLLVESHTGRPTKIEGNPLHPASLGATDAIAQASILTLYDPDRSQTVTHLGRSGSWASFLAAMGRSLEELRLKKGAGLRLLTGTVTSPAMAHQIRSLLASLPEAQWHQYEPAGRDAAREGVRLAFGEYIHSYYRLDRAEVIFSLESDFLFNGLGSLRYTRDFIQKRRISADRKTMNRLYALESTPTNTGAMADHKLSLKPADIARFALAAAAALGVPGLTAAAPAALPDHSRWMDALVRDLQKNRGSSLVIAGEQQPPAVHALAHAMNYVLGNSGATVVYTDPVEAQPVNQMQSLQHLVDDMNAGRVEMLLITDGNPVYSTPADLRFAEHLSKVPLRVHHGLYQDETAALCHWHIPQAHFLETWGDARAFDGTVSLLQPLIEPLYEGRSSFEILSLLLGDGERTAHDTLRSYWTTQHPSVDFEKFWQTALHDGLIPNTALPARQVALTLDARALISGTQLQSPVPNSQSLNLLFRPDPTIGDGRHANNGWLQELPKPHTKLTWDNAALLAPKTAERLGLNSQDVVELAHRGAVVRAPIWIQPGQSEDTVTLHFGYGRWRAGKVGTGVGFDAYKLRHSSAPWHDTGLEIRKTAEKYPLSTTQHHHAIEGRDLLRTATLQRYIENPNSMRHADRESSESLSLYPGHKSKGYAWGMAIDLSSCVGCNACVMACQSENNIPVVGKEQVARGREMHWIRIDRYYQGGLENPQTIYQPVLCMHCESAPCEVVCPVGATVHSPEGLNEMVYNRCIGTRYCSNNCPYKVRRFNFLLYSDFETPSFVPMRNPDVSVRSRGVMEKCAYCVQRINKARIEAEKEDRTIRDGEIVTACQAVCPAEAIVFGDVNDPNSRVSKLKAGPLNYGLLTELNTQPRTSYLARLKNPNPELPEDRAEQGEDRKT